MVLDRCDKLNIRGNEYAYRYVGCNLYLKVIEEGIDNATREMV